MGDNRYYTYIQFYNVLFFLLQISVLILVITSLYYRNKKNKKINSMLIILSFVLTISCMNFLESVIYRADIGLIFKETESICIIAIISLLLFFSTTNKLISHIIPTIYFVAFIILIIYYGIEIIIPYYTLSRINYSVTYGFFQLLGIIVCLIFFTIKKVNMFVKTGRLNIPEIILFISLLLPLGYNSIYNMITYEESQYSYMLFITVIIVYYIMLYKMPTHIMTKSLDEVEKWLDEVIIVTKIKNNFHKYIFIYEDKINIFNPTSIFKYKKIRSSKEKDDIIVEISDKEKRSFYITKTELQKGKKVIGFLFVIKETTVISGMLEELRINNKEYAEKNQSLKDYANIAFKFEMEKEINYLTNEMNDKIGHQMVELLMLAQKAYYEVESRNKTALITMQNTALHAQKILKSVREAVSTYRNFYKE